MHRGILRSNRERYLVDAVPQKYIVCRKLQNNPQNKFEIKVFILVVKEIFAPLH